MVRNQNWCVEPFGSKIRKLTGRSSGLSASAWTSKIPVPAVKMRVTIEMFQIAKG